MSHRDARRRTHGLVRSGGGYPRWGNARRWVADDVERCNAIRLHGAIGYAAPADKLAGREPV